MLTFRGGFPSPLSPGSGIVNSTFVSFMTCKRSSISLGFTYIPGNIDVPAITIKKSALNHLRFIDMRSSGNRARTQFAPLALWSGSEAAVRRPAVTRSYRIGGGRGEKAGNAKACGARRYSSARRSGTPKEIAITKQNVRRIASGKAAATGVSTASSSAARHKKKINRRT
jgi:hypothetical protein